MTHGVRSVVDRIVYNKKGGLLKYILSRLAIVCSPLVWWPAPIKREKEKNVYITRGNKKK